jgi:hypothetical protein
MELNTTTISISADISDGTRFGSTTISQFFVPKGCGKAVELEYPDAQNNLGAMYLNGGLGVPKDLSETFVQKCKSSRNLAKSLSSDRPTIVSSRVGLFKTNLMERSPMTGDMMNVRSLVETSADADLLR